MDVSPETVRLILQALIILLLSIAVHEFGHAIVAHKLGDRLPASQGRVTLNPLVHASPIGTFLFPVLSLLFTKGASIGFGWGRPVEVHPASFSRRFTMRVGHMLVALAGPAMNVLFGTLIAIVHLALLTTGTIEAQRGPGLHSGLFQAVTLNYVLCFFNLIPAPPLDGGAVMKGVLPSRALPAFERFEPYGPFVLMAVIFIPGLAMIFVTPALWMREGVYSLLSMLFGLS
ncbi:site-2 protease family protein [Haliangium ochraceum]|uniref:Peptidase M50 n=1 Tax=Haliangium ochraceum (strain DSM 14365 / JCM 11303 / SMP-2) TaxID=502025 RepID=D0LG94_HALO1|nr:site-2 protease family protein [Haliangium ochraceum]ACY18119.1 peptidase M50 [Haliangium ochraceum DSM 14365]